MPVQEKKVRDLFAAILQVDPNDIQNQTKPENLPKWDSLQHLILVSGFEEEFDLEIDPEEAVEMYKDFETFKRIVLEKLAGN